ncbi:MAG: insulinase family protein [Phycisphaerales bacterium]|nr:insulinase family protein [Phycisphaerales bacterium]
MRSRFTTRRARWLIRVLAAAVPVPLCGGMPAVARPEPAPAGLAPFPGLRSGELANGLSYRVLRHASAPGRASIMLVVRAGGLNETDADRGAARVIAALALDHAGRVAPLAGAEFVAAAGLDATRLTVHLTGLNGPEAEDRLRSALTALGSLAFSLDPDDSGLAANRAQLESRAASRPARARLSEQAVNQLLPNTRLATNTSTRVPAANDPAKVFYGRWFVPANSAVVVVGDIDTDRAARWIDESMVVWAGAQPPPAPDPLDAARPEAVVADFLPIGPGGLSPAFAVLPARPAGASVGPRAASASDAAYVSDAAQLVVLTPRGPAATEGEIRAGLAERLAMAGLSRRLGIMVDRGEIPAFSASAGVARPAAGLSAAWVSLEGARSSWRDLAAALGAQAARARAQGLGEDELEAARGRVLSDLRREAEEEPGLTPARVAEQIARDWVDRGVTSSAAERLAAAEALLPAIGAGEARAALATALDADRSMYLVVAEDPPPPAAAVLEAVRTGAARGGGPGGPGGRGAPAPTRAEPAPMALDRSEPAAAGLDAAGGAARPGEIDELSLVPPGVLSAWLESNIRLHVLGFPEPRRRAHLRLTIAGGREAEPADAPGLARAWAVLWRSPATASRTSTELRDPGELGNVEMSGVVGADRVTIDLVADAAEVGALFRAARLLLEGPEIETAAFERWRASERQDLRERALSPERAALDLLGEADGARPAAGKQSDVLGAITRERFAAFMRAELARAPVEAAFVGPADPQKVLDLAALHLASLPRRERIGAPARAADSAPGAGGGGSGPDLTAELPGPVRESATVLGLTTTAAEGSGRGRLALDLAAQWLSDELSRSLREPGAVRAAVSVVHRPGTGPAGGRLYLTARSDPQAAAEAFVLLDRALLRAAALPDEADGAFAAARQRLADRERARLAEPGAWAAALGSMDFDGGRPSPAEMIGAPAAILSLTPAEVRAALAGSQDPARRFRVTVHAGDRP